ncbi:MAG: molybdopterin dinucleotide-binding protein [Methanotrichaceae archaeon]|nr:molybdopterin dinucleotide-binding protein [Methanotrichaceae archaeon]
MALFQDIKERTAHYLAANLPSTMKDLVVDMKAIMISGRTLAQGASCESKMTKDFFQAASVCSLSEPDYKALDLGEGKNVQIVNQSGQAVFSARLDKGLPPGIIFIPMGPWANILIAPDTGGCGMPQYKGVEVELSPTDSPILDIRALFKNIGGMVE